MRPSHSSCGSNNASVLLGNGGGTFQTHVDYGTGSGSRHVSIGDFNGDGRPLQVAMRDAGFYGLPNEWWHFVIADWQKYLPPAERKRALN